MALFGAGLDGVYGYGRLHLGQRVAGTVAENTGTNACHSSKRMRRSGMPDLVNNAPSST